MLTVRNAMINNKIVKTVRYQNSFVENIAPIKLTEGRRIKLHTVGWGLLTDYYLESVKVSCFKDGVVKSAATIKVGDRSGRVVCVVKGPSIGLLFGISPEEWKQVETMCGCDQQLFYRYFKDGLSSNFSLEQKIFYNFCLSNQTSDVLFAVLQRGVNRRNKDKSDAFLEIIELRKSNPRLLDLYVDHLQNSVDVLS